MVLFPELVNLDLMKGKQNRLMAVEGIDPKESSKEYGNEILEKILKFFPFFFETKSE